MPRRSRRRARDRLRALSDIALIEASWPATMAGSELSRRGLRHEGRVEAQLDVVGVAERRAAGEAHADDVDARLRWCRGCRGRRGSCGRGPWSSAASALFGEGDRLGGLVEHLRSWRAARRSRRGRCRRPSPSPPWRALPSACPDVISVHHLVPGADQRLAERRGCPSASRC